MNALFLSDLHGAEWPTHATVTTEGVNTRFQDLLDVIDQTAAYQDEVRADDLILPGDLLHRRHFIRFRLYNRLADRLVALTRLFKKTIMTPGNHDWEDDRTHSLHIFRYVPDIRVIDEPAVVTLADGDRVTIVPYMPDPAAVTHAFETAPREHVIVAHYATEGVPLESDYWLESPLKIGECERFPLAIFGHVHKPSTLNYGRVIYLGAPLHFDFGDEGPRYVHWVRNLVVQRRELTFPRFVTARYPRLPPLRPGARGFLRVLDVPDRAWPDVKAQGAALGYTTVTPLRAAVPPEMATALTKGGATERDTLVDYVARKCGTLSPDEQVATVEAGWALLQEGG